MRSNLSKSLRLNCGESGCPEGGNPQRTKQRASVEATGDTAHRQTETTISVPKCEVKSKERRLITAE